MQKALRTLYTSIACSVTWHCLQRFLFPAGTSVCKRISSLFSKRYNFFVGGVTIWAIDQFTAQIFALGATAAHSAFQCPEESLPLTTTGNSESHTRSSAAAYVAVSAGRSRHLGCGLRGDECMSKSENTIT